MTSEPLISCICITTASRRAFLERSIAAFLRQDYTHKELIIVADGTVEHLVDIIPDVPHVEYVFVDRRGTTAKMTNGAKRNLAVSLARGSIIATWDDDDVYGPHRLTRQAQPLLDGTCELTGLRTGAIYNISTGECFTLDNSVHKQMFHANVHGGTIMYWKHVWEKAQYPNVNVGEDAEFMRRAIPAKKVVQVPNHGDFVYIRHGGNAWSFTAGTHIDAEGWQRVGIEHYLPAEDIAFYQTFRENAKAT